MVYSVQYLTFFFGAPPLFAARRPSAIWSIEAGARKGLPFCSSAGSCLQFSKTAGLFLPRPARNPSAGHVAGCLPLTPLRQQDVVNRLMAHLRVEEQVAEGHHRVISDRAFSCRAYGERQRRPQFCLMVKPNYESGLQEVAGLNPKM